jgi:lipoic acid synthetase
MILGNTCTRGCRFCDVDKGRPSSYDRDEPFRIAESVMRMKVQYAVITSVTRDDLPDQGSEVWAETILAVRQASPQTRIEALTPDFQGKTSPLDTVLEARPDIFNHNFETVARLQKEVRGRANIQDSSAMLQHAKSKGFLTKTSFMLGIGETRNEISEMIALCAELKVDIVTFGQYLQPSARHLAVQQYVPPEEFEDIRRETLEAKIPVCVSGPRVRSSYHADRQSAPLFSQ